jgi:hypothetical protein
MCYAQDVLALRMGPAASEWLMLATLAAFYAVQIVQRLRPAWRIAQSR